MHPKDREMLIHRKLVRGLDRRKKVLIILISAYIVLVAVAVVIYKYAVMTA
jgi:flagellar basal body-associated protein FliL